VKKLLERAELVVVVGSPRLVERNRLVELARKAGVARHHGAERRRDRPGVARRRRRASASPRAPRRRSCSSSRWSSACASLARRRVALRRCPVDEGVVFQIPPELR
jgi:hypothetical protein